MSDEFYGRRKSGRTTRMLRAALAAVVQGRSVLVVVHDALYAAQIRARITKLVTDEGYRYPVESVDKLLHVTSMSDPMWDIRAHDQYRGAPAVKVYIDHFAVQTYMQQYERLLHKWD